MLVGLQIVLVLLVDKYVDQPTNLKQCLMFHWKQHDKSMKLTHSLTHSIYLSILHLDYIEWLQICEFRTWYSYQKRK